MTYSTFSKPTDITASEFAIRLAAVLLVRLSRPHPPIRRDRERQPPRHLPLPTVEWLVRCQVRPHRPAVPQLRSACFHTPCDLPQHLLFQLVEPFVDLQ